MNKTNPEGGGRRQGGFYAGKRKRPTKKHIKEQKFVIHPDELFSTTIDLHSARKNCATIPLDGSQTEDEIRESLMEKLPQLRGISFRLFTKSKQGNHFCPCSPECIDSSHAQSNIEEWNAKNIRKMARGHKVVYIHCQQRRSETPNTDSMPITGCPQRAKLLPDHALDSDLSEEDIRQLIGDINLQDRIDQQFNDCTNLGRLPLQEDVDSGEEEQEQGDEEGEDGDDSSSSSEEEDGMKEMLGESEVHASISGPDSAYQTGSAKSMNVAQGREAASATSRMEEGITSSRVSIVHITPKEGNIEGGYEFYLRLNTALVGSVGQLQVLFGDLPADSVMLTADKDLVIGYVPPSSISGVVQVSMLNNYPISTNTVPFEYKSTDEKLEEGLQEFKMFIDKNAMSPGVCLEMTSMLIKKMMELNTKEGTNCKENTKTRALSHLRLIVEAAAKINAVDFFAIIFSTSVGRNVFKCFKGDDLLLEEVARGNGHEELACFLEQKHSMYREDESDSDDEVDWESLAKALKTFQRQNSEGSKPNRSWGSSEDSFAYNGDEEDSALSLISEMDRSWETFTEDPFEEEGNSALGKCEVGPQTIIPEESISWSKSSFSDRASSVIGRDAECEEIIDKLASSQFRVAVIYGVLGIGKTSLAVVVGDKLLSKGWIVDYHVCSDLKATMDLLTMLSRPSQMADPANPTLLILDQVENLLEDEQSVFVPEALQAVLEPSLDVSYVRVLLVSRKQIFFKDDLAFRFRLESLSKVAAIELLRRGSKISCEDELGVISEGCGYNPLALKIILALLHEGMPEMEIASEMSTPGQFWKSLVEKILYTRDAETKVVKKDILEGHLSRLLLAESTLQMQLFFESWVEGESYQMEDKDSLYSEKVSDPRYCHCKLCMRPSRSTASPAGSQNQTMKKEEGNDSKLGTSKPLTAHGDINKETSVASSHAASASSSYTNLSVKTRNENITASMLPQGLSLRENERRKQLLQGFCGLFITLAIGVALSLVGIAFSASFKADQELESKDPIFSPVLTPCTKTQFLVKHADGSTSCLNCEKCLPGKGLPHKCGTNISSLAKATCVPCQPGISFSNSFDTSSCTPCAPPCFKDQVVLQNCTAFRNIKCAKQCYSKDRYYDHTSMDCLVCSKCCGDDGDVVEDECKKKLGATSNKICSFHSSVNRCSTTTASVHGQRGTTALTRPTNSSGTPSDTTDLWHFYSPYPSAEIIAVVSMFGILVIILISCSASYLFLKRKTRSSQTGCHHSEAEVGVRESHKDAKDKKSILNDQVELEELQKGPNNPLLGMVHIREDTPAQLTCECQTHTKKKKCSAKDPLRLCQLKSISLDAYESIWKRLDKQPEGTNKGHFRAVANDFGLVQEDIWELEKEFKVPGSGSPSRQLLECLEAKLPELTVVDFIEVLRKPNIDRNDIVDILKDYLYK